MRGDRPTEHRAEGRRDQATPHARGSTRRHSSRLAQFPGYPACAGIDPFSSSHGQASFGLPRMRGDRPRPGRHGSSSTKATPHARGSTQRRELVGSVEAGYPACAGIDPPSARELSRRGRLPRMRGDRPTKTGCQEAQFMATPHARGSTVREGVRQVADFGYPACAGIDPCAISSPPRYARLPRMRGDRPDLWTWLKETAWATPHARGSTRACDSGIRPGRGYPACAGIDLRASFPAAARQGLPRMRGDRPWTVTAAGDAWEATPHARGSTSKSLPSCSAS